MLTRLNTPFNFVKPIPDRSACYLLVLLVNDDQEQAASNFVGRGANRVIPISEIGMQLPLVVSETAAAGERILAYAVERVCAMLAEIEAMAGDAGTGLSKGGMKTKVMAARTATAAGCAGSSDRPTLKPPTG